MKNFSTIVFSIVFLFLISCESSSEPETNPAISISVLSESINVGSQVEVFVKIVDFPDDVFAISGRLSFDENRITISNDQADWMGNIWSSSAIGFLNIEDGIIYFSVSQIAGSGNADNQGTSLTIEITADVAGTTSIDLLPSQLSLYDSDGEELDIDNLDIDGVSLIIE